MFPSPTALTNRLLARGKFRHLQVLVRLAQLGSIQRTAEAIGTTPSAVTQMLAYLEELLETPLFDRHARGVRPTPACVELLPVARQMLAALHEGAEAIAARRQHGSVLRMVSSVSGTHGLLLGTLPAFARQHPAVRVHLREAEGDEQLLALARGEVDLCVCRQPAAVPAGWVFVPLIEDRCSVVCASGHPLLRAPRVGLPLLAAQTWLLSPTGSLARTAFDELAARFAAPPATHPVVTRTFTMTVALLRAGEGITVLPESIVRHLVDAGELALLPLPGLLAMGPLGLLRPAEGFSDGAARLCDFLQQAAQRSQAKLASSSLSPDL